METVQKKGMPFVALLFLALGVIKLLKGDDWVVWILLAALLGGVSALAGAKARGGSDHG